MMRLLVVNPNSTAEMTARMAAQLARELPDHIHLTERTNHDGPPSIEGEADGDASVPGTLALLQQIPFDMAIIGCFDDTGLEEARARHGDRVIGIGDACYRHAAELNARFAVLTTSPLSVPVLKRNVARSGFGPICTGVFASNVPVLDFESARAAATERMIAAGRDLQLRDRGTDIVVLGCAGMGGLAEAVSEALGLPVLDPMRTAARAAITYADGSCGDAHETRRMEKE